MPNLPWSPEDARLRRRFAATARPLPDHRLVLLRGPSPGQSA
jgi:hypothetical protein